jgi:hypothetical protein
VPLLLPSLAGLFIYSSPEIFPLPHSPGLRAPCPLCYVSFFSAACLLLFVFFSLFFPPEWGSVCPGGYADLAQCCLWEYHMPLSSSGGLHLHKQSWSWHMVAREPSWFLHLTWSGDVMRRLEVGQSRSFASSWWFFLQGVSLESLQDFTLRSTLSASSL